MDKLFLLALIVGLYGYWLYKLTTYNWDNFEEDSKNDDFLKTIDNIQK